MILLRRPWTVQPPLNPPGFSVFNGNQLWLPGDSDIKATFSANGVGCVWPDGGATPASAVVATPIEISLISGFTLVTACIGDRTSTKTSNTAVSVSGTAYSCVSLGVYTQMTYGDGLMAWNIDTSLITPASNVANAGEYRVGVATCSADGTAMRCLSGGVFTSVSGGSAFDNSKLKYFTVGGWYRDFTSYTNQFAGQILMAALIPRYMGAAEMTSLSLNPWQLFAPRRIIFSAASAAITAPTLLAASAMSITTSSAIPRVTFTRP